MVRTQSSSTTQVGKTQSRAIKLNDVVKTLAKSETPFFLPNVGINDPPSGTVPSKVMHPSLRDLARPVDLAKVRMVGGGGPCHWQTGGLLEWKEREERRCARQCVCARQYSRVCVQGSSSLSREKEPASAKCHCASPRLPQRVPLQVQEHSSRVLKE